MRRMVGGADDNMGNAHSSQKPLDILAKKGTMYHEDHDEEAELDDKIESTSQRIQQKRE